MLWKSVMTLATAGVLVLLGFGLAVSDSGDATPALPTVADVLAHYVTAIGGSDAIAGISSRHMTGRVITDLSARKEPIFESHYFEAFAMLPARYHTNTWTDGGNFIRAYDGNRGWSKDRCGLQNDPTGGHRRLDWLLNPHNALVIQEYFPDLTVDSTLEIRGFTVYSLTSPALHRPFYFDTNTGLLIGIGPNWEIHDYREIDGVLFPHKIVMSRKGGSTTYEFDRVEHNIEIDASLFTPSD